MKKLISIILIALAFAGVAFAQTPALDQIYMIPWISSNRGVHYVLTDKEMAGYKDTSVAITIPRGTRSMDFWVDADSSLQDSAGVIEADTDSIFYIGYMVPVGQNHASWVIAGDTLIETAQADSGATGMWHWAQLADTFWTQFIYPPSDSAATPRAVGAGNLYGRKYEAIQFVVRLGGVDGVISDTGSIANRAFLRFNSQSWRQEDAKSGH